MSERYIKKSGIVKVALTVEKMEILKRIKQRIKENRIKRIIRRRSEKIYAQVASCGENLQVFGDCEIVVADKVTLGDNCKLNADVYINARSGVSIGNDVTLSYGVKILSTGYDIEKWITTGQKIHFDNTPVTIGDHCWICAGATILPGVKISGEYVIVGADAVVTKDITESRVIVAGSPARIVKRL